MGAPGGSDIFASCETDYNNISAAVSRRINSQIPNFSGEQKKEAIRAAQRELDEADEILEQMDMELKGLPSAVRAKLSPRYNNFKTDLAKLKKDLARVSSTNRDRDELFAGGTSDYDSASMDQRQRLLAANARMEKSTQTLEQARSLAEQTVDVGANTLSTLQGQREQILRTRDLVSVADENVDKSSRVISGMQRRMATNKIITAVIVLVLLGIIGLIIYLVIPKGETPTSAPTSVPTAAPSLAL